MILVHIFTAYDIDTLKKSVDKNINTLYRNIC